MIQRAVEMATTIQRALAEARCPVRIDVNWTAFGKVPGDFATELTRFAFLEGPIAVVQKAKATYQRGKEHRPRRPKVLARDGTISTSHAKPEEVEVIEVRPLFFGKHAGSPWRYTVAAQQVIFTWIELPQRQAEFQQHYPADWTWFPTLKSADNREKTYGFAL